MGRGRGRVLVRATGTRPLIFCSLNQSPPLPTPPFPHTQTSPSAPRCSHSRSKRDGQPPAMPPHCSSVAGLPGSGRCPRCWGIAPPGQAGGKGGECGRQRAGFSGTVGAHTGRYMGRAGTGACRGGSGAATVPPRCRTRLSVGEGAGWRRRRRAGGHRWRGAGGGCAGAGGGGGGAATAVGPVPGHGLLKPIVGKWCQEHSCQLFWLEEGLAAAALKPLTRLPHAAAPPATCPLCLPCDPRRSR